MRPSSARRWRRSPPSSPSIGPGTARCRQRRSRFSIATVSNAVTPLRLLPIEESAQRGEKLGMLDWLATANIFRGLLHSPSAASAVYGVIDALIFHNTVAARTRELVILRIG